MSELCKHLGDRLKHLNTLDRRVTKITNKLNERMKSINNKDSSESSSSNGGESSSSAQPSTSNSDVAEESDIAGRRLPNTISGITGRRLPIFNTSNLQRRTNIGPEIQARFNNIVRRMERDSQRLQRLGRQGISRCINARNNRRLRPNFYGISEESRLDRYSRLNMLRNRRRVMSRLERESTSLNIPEITITLANDLNRARNNGFTNGNNPLLSSTSQQRQPYLERQENVPTYERPIWNGGIQGRLLSQSEESLHYRRNFHSRYGRGLDPTNFNNENIDRLWSNAFSVQNDGIRNNVLDITHRIQFWDFSKCDIPVLTDCKYSCDI